MRMSHLRFQAPVRGIASIGVGVYPINVRIVTTNHSMSAANLRRLELGLDFASTA
ncbi:hypothetical protein ACVW17_003422 [Bradyrhizobium sp. USDA 4473]